MPSHPFDHARRLPARPHRRHGFTLIEVLIVVAIIITLAAISVFVGGAVKRQSSKRATAATLHTLQALMDAYLKDGNPEPVWSETNPGTNPKTDPTNFVRALRATEGSGTKLQSLPFSDDKKSILDAFGNPIRFVPTMDTTVTPPQSNSPFGRPYFLSAGPDGLLFNSSPPPPDVTTDNVSSLDN